MLDQIREAQRLERQRVSVSREKARRELRQRMGEEEVAGTVNEAKESLLTWKKLLYDERGKSDVMRRLQEAAARKMVDNGRGGGDGSGEAVIEVKRAEAVRIKQAAESMVRTNYFGSASDPTA